MCIVCYNYCSPFSSVYHTAGFKCVLFVGGYNYCSPFSSWPTDLRPPGQGEKEAGPGQSQEEVHLEETLSRAERSGAERDLTKVVKKVCEGLGTEDQLDGHVTE